MVVSGQEVVIFLHFDLLGFEQILCRVGSSTDLGTLHGLIEFGLLISELRVIASIARWSCK